MRDLRRAQRADLLFECFHGTRVTFADGDPLVEQPLRTRIEPRVGGRRPLVAVAPELQRDGQSIDLCLQIGEPLFERGHFLKHGGVPGS